MKVLSLFNGMNCIGLALHGLGRKFKVYASEIDKYATKVSDTLFPETVNLGDVVFVRRAICWKDSTIQKALSSQHLSTKTKQAIRDLLFLRGIKFDLVVAGSPCQGFSFAGKRLNFDDPRSKLFFEFVKILNSCKAKNQHVKWLLENVRMSKEHQDVISECVGIEPIKINSSLVSAQNRVRLYWTNICAYQFDLFGKQKCGIKQPEDKLIMLADVLELEVNEKYMAKISKDGKLKSKQNKASCFTAGGNSGGNHSDMDLFVIFQKGTGFNKGGVHKEKSRTVTSNSFEHNNHVVQLNPAKEFGGQPRQQNRVYAISGKSPCLTKGCAHHQKVATRLKSKTVRVGRRGPKDRHEWDAVDKAEIRRLSPRECGRLQTIPEWAIDKMLSCGVSDTQIYKMLGNGWTVAVIEHILKHL